MAFHKMQRECSATIKTKHNKQKLFVCGGSSTIELSDGKTSKCSNITAKGGIYYDAWYTKLWNLL